MQKSRWVGVVASLVILVLIFVFGGVKPAEVWASVQRFSGWTVGGALALGLAQIFFQCMRVHFLIAPSLKLRWYQTIRVFNIGQVLNNFLPAKVGYAYKVVSLGKLSREPHAVARAVGGIFVADKIADILALLVLVGGFAPMALAELMGGGKGQVLGWVGGGIAALALLAWVFRARIRGWIPPKSASAVRDALATVTWRTAVTAQTFAFLSWLAECAIIILLCSAQGFPLSFSQGILVLLALNVGIAVPVSVANVGTFEASMVFGLSRLGIPAEAGMAIATVHHGVQLSALLLMAAPFAFRKDLGMTTAETSGFRVGENDKKRAAEYYESLSGDYNGAVERGLLAKFRARERGMVLGYADLYGKYDAIKKKTMIDVGCGGGVYALEAKRAGMRVCATDFAPGMVERIRPRVDEAYVSDIESLPVTKQYDVVVCAGVLDFVLDPTKAFGNLCQLVAPGGRLVVMVPHHSLGGLIYRVEKFFAKMKVNLYSVKWMREQARHHGLELVSYAHPLPTNVAVLFTRS
ncbi:MAG: lysylphosphatidylglycerol synthase domain-containing protein [Bacteriovoracia bacterium]